MGSYAQAAYSKIVTRMNRKGETVQDRITWNIAGVPRTCGRNETILRWHCLDRDAFTCQVSECEFCRRNGTLGLPQHPDFLQVDHIRPFAANGLGSLAFRYGAAATNADGSLVEVTPTGRKVSFLVVPREVRPNGLDRLIGIYGMEHAQRVLGDSYNAEFDPYVCLTVCQGWNQFWSDRIKQDETGLLAIAAARQNAYGRWSFDNNRSFTFPTWSAAMAVARHYQEGHSRGGSALQRDYTYDL